MCGRHNYECAQFRWDVVGDQGSFWVSAPVLGSQEPGVSVQGSLCGGHANSLSVDGMWLVVRGHLGPAGQYFDVRGQLSVFGDQCVADMRIRSVWMWCGGWSGVILGPASQCSNVRASGQSGGVKGRMFGGRANSLSVDGCVFGFECMIVAFVALWM